MTEAQFSVICPECDLPVFPDEQLSIKINPNDGTFEVNHYDNKYNQTCAGEGYTGLAFKHPSFELPKASGKNAV